MEENSRPFWRQAHESFYGSFKLANKRIQREMTPLVSALLATDAYSECLGTKEVPWAPLSRHQGGVVSSGFLQVSMSCDLKGQKIWD